MNIFVPQSVQAMIELSEIADVRKQIITPRMSTPIIGIVQDGILGAYNLTDSSMRINWRDVMNIMSYTTIDSFKAIKKNKEYTGQEVFSLIIPAKINSDRKGLVVKKGEIVDGQLTNQHLGDGKDKSLIHLIWNMYGSDEARRFIDNTQRLVNNFNMLNGFTVGIGDINIPPEITKQLKQMFETKKLEIDHMITSMENNPEMHDMEVFERNVNGKLNSVLGDAEKVVMAALSKDNKFRIMIESGAKGKTHNMAQMGGCIGQTAVEGKRVKKKLHGRTLSCFAQNDDSATARGFIDKSFFEGMDPVSFIFHNMGSREGLIDTAIKSVTGDTPVIIMEEGVCKRVLIGDWIDNLLQKSPEDIEHHEDRDMELLNLKQKFYIPTSDLDGNMEWGWIKAITRHDPGKELFEIKTHGGREVIVTESKSLLVWSEEDQQFMRKDTADVTVGDFVPVTQNLPECEQYSLKEANKEVYRIMNGQNTITLKTTEEVEHLVMMLNIKGLYSKIEGLTVTIEDISNYRTKNDVVLDRIVSIKTVDIKKYPKVYDLTVPSTLNFGLANGLQVVDTATSGYIQRKLIKSMEDAHVTYDMSVRTSTAGVLQFYYGGNGIDTTKQYKHTLDTLHMGNKELEDMLKFNTKELKNHPYKDNDKFYNEFLGLRDEMRDAIMALSHNRVKMEKDFMIPVNLNLIVTTVRNDSMKSDGKLTAEYIYEKIHDILKYENTLLTAMSKKEANDPKSVKVRDEQVVKTLLKFAMYQYLAPKRCLIEYDLNKAQFDAIVERIISEFNESVVHPGEMVGVLAAQSIGEPTTQLSTTKKERIPAKIVDYSGNICYHTGAIGDLVDHIFEKQCEQQKELGKDSIVGIPDCKLYISTVNRDTEKQEWKLVSEVSRHPANGKLCKITTKTGRNTVTTLSHSHLQRTDDGKIIPKVAKDLKVGDYIPVVKQMNTHGKVIRDVDGFDLDFENGWLVGAYLSEGSINGNRLTITNISEHFEKRVKEAGKKHNLKYKRREKSGKILPNYPEYSGVDHTLIDSKEINQFLLKHCGKGSKNKFIPGFALFAPDEFVSGLLRGYFDGDGNINGQRQLIRVHSISQQLVEGIALLLSRFGIFATFGTEKKYRENPLYTLKILRKFAQVFKDKIGTDFTEKAEQLKMIIDYNNSVTTKKNECDMIPMIGKTIADAALPLKLPGYSRNYKRWIKKPAVGRDTLEKYYKLFTERLKEDDFKDVDIKKELAHMKQALDNNIVWDPITEIEILDDPNELVYDLSVEGNHTFMMLNGIFVHNTLNSINWTDRVIIENDGNYETKMIGEFIDRMIKQSDKVERPDDNVEEEMGDTYYLDVSDKDIKTISVDSDGKLSWNKVTALTKHLPMNTDGTHDLLRITTKTGRMVTATKAKSFLTLRDGKVIPIRGDELETGLKVPVMRNIPKIEGHNMSYQKLVNKYRSIDKEDNVHNDVYMDEIIDIETIQPTHEYVYDMTVDKDKTFATFEGIMMYDTFHSAGIGAKGTTTLGTTRMSELMSFSKNMKTPQMLIYMTEEFNKNKAMAEKIASSIKYTTIGDVRDMAEVFWDPDPFNDDGYVKKDNVFNIFYSHRPSRNSCQQEITGLPWLLRIHLNKEQMMEKNITLLDIKSRFCNHWEKRYTDPKSVKKDQRKYIEKIGAAAIVSNSDNDETPIIHIRFSMNTYNYELITGFVETIVDNFTLKGIDTIEGVEGVETDVVVKYDSEDQNVEAEKQQVIYTKGADLVAIRYLKGIDLLKTSTNDVIQIYENFGIEAARIAILREINKVFESSNINFQHISILIDTMTQTGGMTSIDRHGLHKLDTDPLARASFEKQVEQFLQAAVFGESDHMKSVSSRIMGGLAIKGGTGLCNVTLDVEMLQNSEYIEGQDVGYDKGFTELETDIVVEDIVEKKEETNVWLPL